MSLCRWYLWDGSQSPFVLLWLVIVLQRVSVEPHKILLQYFMRNSTLHAMLASDWSKLPSCVLSIRYGS